jgi:hypothetical protein
MYLVFADFNPKDRALRAQGDFAEGFRYVWKRHDLKVILAMLFLIGTVRTELSDIHLDDVCHSLSRRSGPNTDS